MNLLLLEPGEVTGGRARLADRRAEHLLTVLKVEPGKTLRAGVVDGGVGEARVVAVDGDAVELEVAVGAPPPPATVDLAVALPRPQALHRVLQTAAAMGVGRLDLVNAWRVEKSFFASPSLRPETVRRHLLLGAEQGMTTRLPRVHVHRLLVAFLEGLARDAPGCRLLAHPEAPAIETAADAGAPRFTVAIGPEGGWIDREVESFAAAGFRAVSLGPWILRVETAVGAALAQLELLRRTSRPLKNAEGRSSAAC